MSEQTHVSAPSDRMTRIAQARHAATHTGPLVLVPNKHHITSETRPWNRAPHIVANHAKVTS